MQMYFFYNFKAVQNENCIKVLSFYDTASQEAQVSERAPMCKISFI